MVGKRASTWSLIKTSWDILKSDKELVIFPLFSGLSLLLVLASFASSYFWAPGFWQSIRQDLDAPRHQQHLSALGYVVLFCFYFCNYAVISFFNSGLIFCALAKMNGGNASAREGLRQAAKRLPQIFLWAAIAASVGMILRAIAERSGLVGKFVSDIIGIAFSLASFLVIPVMVAEDKTPFQALKQSAELFKKTWGTQIKGSISFGGIFALLLIPAFVMVPVAVIFLQGNIMLISLAIGLIVAYIIVILLGQSALSAIFQSALYIYGKTGTPPAGYSKDDLHAAVKLK